MLVPTDDTNAVVKFQLQVFNIIYYILAIGVVIVEIHLSILGFYYYDKDVVAEIDDGRCNFSQKLLNTAFLPYYAGFDLLISMTCLVLFLLCLRRLSVLNINSPKQKLDLNQVSSQSHSRPITPSATAPKNSQSTNNFDSNTNSNTNGNGNDEDNNNGTMSLRMIIQKEEVHKTVERVKFWSIVAMLSTMIAGLISAFVDGGSPIFLVGDIGMLI